MECILRGGKYDNCVSLSMYVHFTESSGGVLGANLIRGHVVVFDVENGRAGFTESDCDEDRATKEKEERE